MDCRRADGVGRCDGDQDCGFVEMPRTRRRQGFRIDCACPERGSGESDVLAALENAVEEGLGELSIVQDLAPSLERLVGWRRRSGDA